MDKHCCTYLGSKSKAASIRGQSKQRIKAARGEKETKSEKKEKEDEGGGEEWCEDEGEAEDEQLRQLARTKKEEEGKN